MSLCTPSLSDYGWNNFFAACFSSYASPQLQAARVIAEHKDCFRLFTRDGERLASVAGRIRYQDQDWESWPAVGDWVVCRIQSAEVGVMIQQVLPRRSCIVRQAAGTRTHPQIIGANVDTVFVVISLNANFKLRRVERYCTLVWESGARPVIVLTKADLCGDVASKVVATQAVAPGVAVHAVSVVTGVGLPGLAQYLSPGQTVALLGSSGVGKSTLINTLLGAEVLRVNEIREDDGKGRHTTTHRQLILLPSGGLVLDTPGMRELALWEGAEGLQETFADIEELAQACYFRNCQHQHEPECAVLAALAEGRLEPGRYESYGKLQRELTRQQARTDTSARLKQKKANRQMGRLIKEIYRTKRR